MENQGRNARWLREVSSVQGAVVGNRPFNCIVDMQLKITPDIYHRVTYRGFIVNIDEPTVCGVLYMIGWSPVGEPSTTMRLETTHTQCSMCDYFCITVDGDKSQTSREIKPGRTVKVRLT